MTSLVDRLLYRHLRQGRADRVAIASDLTIWTYAELAARVDRHAAVLAPLLSAGDRALMRLPSGADFVAIWLAVQRVGAVPVATSPELRGREVDFVLADAAPRAAIVAADRLHGVADPLRQASERCATFVLDGGDAGLRPLNTAAPSEQTHVLGPPVEREAGAPVVLSYATDATAAPKGVGHTTDELTSACEAYAGSILRATPDDVFGGAAPMYYAFGLGNLLLCPLLVGAATAPVGAFTTEGLCRVIRDRRVTILFGTASAYRLLLKLPALEAVLDLRSLRLAVSAGEHLEGSTAAEWRRRAGCDLLNGFGTTETVAIFLSGRENDLVPGSLGTSVPGFEVRLVADGGRAADHGLLEVRGPAVGVPWRDGVWKPRPRGSWLGIADRLRLDGDGRHWYVGRADDLIVSAGYNISPAEVALALESHPWVARAVVDGVADEIRGTAVRAEVSWKPGVAGGEAAVRALREHAQTCLAAYKCPRHYREA